MGIVDGDRLGITKSEAAIVIEKETKVKLFYLLKQNPQEYLLISLTKNQTKYLQK
jgi:hypothetical protein